MIADIGQPGCAWGRLVRFFPLLLLALVASFVPVPSLEPLAQIQPELRASLRGSQASEVDVIVRKTAGDVAVEQHVARLGGTVTQDLGLINAFAARLPKDAIAHLSQMPGVRSISLDAPVRETGDGKKIDVTNLRNAYIQTVGIDKLWNESPRLQGTSKIGVAIVDSGITLHSDLTRRQNDKPRTKIAVDFSSTGTTTNDMFGHGTHVAGIIGGNGEDSGGAYIGVAPDTNLINVKVTRNDGSANTSDVVAGLHWIYQNRERYNIRVVNLSLNSTVAESYHTSPLDAAVEILWLNNIVVVVSAGNNEDGPNDGILFPPANDPFVITVGATDDRGTTTRNDDVLASFSAHGTTTDGFTKPDLVAPGKNIVSLLASPHTVLAQEHADHVVEDGQKRYFRMSGTSMAAPVVAGTVALLLQDEPHLTPDQVKYRLMATTRPFASPGAGSGYLDAYAAVHGTTQQRANVGIRPSELINLNSDGSTTGSVSWTSVSWTSVSWTSVSWSSDYWGD